MLRAYDIESLAPQAPSGFKYNHHFSLAIYLAKVTIYTKQRPRPYIDFIFHTGPGAFVVLCFQTLWLKLLDQRPGSLPPKDFYEFVRVPLVGDCFVVEVMCSDRKHAAHNA